MLEQRIVLEYESHTPLADTHRGNILAKEQDRPLGPIGNRTFCGRSIRCIHSSDDPEQCRLSRPRWTEQRHEFPRFDFQIDIAECGKTAVRFGNTSNFDAHVDSSCPFCRSSFCSSNVFAIKVMMPKVASMDANANAAAVL